MNARAFLALIRTADGEVCRTLTDHTSERAADAERQRIEAGGFYLGQRVLQTWTQGPGVVATRRVCVLSTAHMTAETLALLNGLPLPAWPVCGGVLPHGFYIYVHDADEGAPDDLRTVFAWARGRFDYIQFDCDEEPLDILPTYEHG